MANFDVEKMLSEGLNKDEIWKKFDAEIKNAQNRLDQKAKAEEDKKKKEAMTENKRITAITALKEYFRDVGYDYVKISLDEYGINVDFKMKLKKTDKALKDITEKMREYREYEKSNDYPSIAQLIEAFGEFDF